MARSRINVPKENMSPSEGTAQRIVVGIDGSPPSVEAVRWAIKQAELTGASVDAVSAWQYPASTGAYGWAPQSGFDNIDFEGLTAEALRNVIEQVSPPASVTLRQLVVEGNPAQVLLDAAADADLLVVGSRGHGAFTDALIGSVSERCVRHAHCPVLVMHHH
jgi:nucleotide-binding universal stress UspA family protein